MIRLICICCAFLFGEASYGMSRAEAAQECWKLSQIGTSSEDGEKITITSDLLKEYEKTKNLRDEELFVNIPENFLLTICFAAAADTEVGQALFDAFVEKAGKYGKKGIISLGAYSLVGPLLRLGTNFECIVSRQEYFNALIDEGPIEAALTNPQGDSCNIL